MQADPVCQLQVLVCPWLPKKNDREQVDYIAAGLSRPLGLHPPFRAPSVEQSQADSRSLTFHLDKHTEMGSLQNTQYGIDNGHMCACKCAVSQVSDSLQNCMHTSDTRVTARLHAPDVCM